MDLSSNKTLVVDHIGGMRDNNDIKNFRIVTQRNNLIAGFEKPCALIDPLTNEREEYRLLSLAADAIGYPFGLAGTPNGRYLVGKMKSKGIVWKGKLRKRVWVSFVNDYLLFWPDLTFTL
jgi:hypothetical protein